MEHAWVDEQLVEERLETVGALMADLVRRYEEQWVVSPPADQADDEKLMMLLHKLAGGAGSLGMPRLAAGLKTAEAAVRDGGRPDLPALNQLADESLRQLKERLGGQGGTSGSS